MDKLTIKLGAVDRGRLIYVLNAYYASQLNDPELTEGQKLFIREWVNNLLKQLYEA